MQTILSTLLSGLRDYTIDERGDVGSWIRIACVQGLTSCIEDLFSVAESVTDFADYLPVSSYQQAIAGILKQGVERLDNVRQEAGTCISRLSKLTPVQRAELTWSLPSLSLLQELIFGIDETPSSVVELSKGERVSWADGAWLFPRAIKLLDVPEYRIPLLTGLIFSLASRTESTVTEAALNCCILLPLMTYS